MLDGLFEMGTSENRHSDSKLRCASMAFSILEQLQIVYINNSSKYNIEKSKQQLAVKD